MSNGAIPVGWEIANKNLKSGSIGSPIVIESYTPHENIRTTVMATKIYSGNMEQAMLMSVNFCSLKDRLITYSYFKRYDGPESLKHLKTNSDYFGFQLVEANKNN